MANRPLPREPAGATCAIRAEVWNELVSRLERAERIVGGKGVTVTDSPSGKVISALFSLPSNVIRKVDLSAPVGSLGTDTTKPEATYTVTIDGVALDGSYPVDNRPMDVGVVSAATEGLFYKDADGIGHIYSCNEAELSTNCTPPP